MQLRVREYEGGVDIELVGIAGRQLDVLFALSACRDGQCTCATNEHAKLETMSVRSRSNEMRIRMQAKIGQQFDADSVYRCLKDALHTKPSLTSSLLTT